MMIWGTPLDRGVVAHREDEDSAGEEKTTTLGESGSDFVVRKQVRNGIVAREDRGELIAESAREAAEICRAEGNRESARSGLVAGARDGGRRKVRRGDVEAELGQA